MCCRKPTSSKRAAIFFVPSVVYDHQFTTTEHQWKTTIRLSRPLKMFAGVVCYCAVRMFPFLCFTSTWLPFLTFRGGGSSTPTPLPLSFLGNIARWLYLFYVLYGYYIDSSEGLLYVLLYKVLCNEVVEYVWKIVKKFRVHKNCVYSSCLMSSFIFKKLLHLDKKNYVQFGILFYLSCC